MTDEHHAEQPEQFFADLWWKAREIEHEHGPKAAQEVLQRAFAAREANLVGALKRIATVDMGGGFVGAQACRKVATAALKSREASHG